MIREPGWGAVEKWQKGVLCYGCQGEKEFWHPDDPRDPIEGNKMRRVIKCPVCQGSGKLESFTVKNHLKWCLEEYADLN